MVQKTPKTLLTVSYSMFIRVYSGEYCNDYLRKLALPNPTLPNGTHPPGFLGYAVNMIDPGIGYCHWRTRFGYGLRETLFYHLFGQLQVYDTMEHMNKASPCITQSAVSLDGGIIRNRMFVVGCR